MNERTEHEFIPIYETMDPDLDLASFKKGISHSEQYAPFEQKWLDDMKSIDRFRLHPMIHQTTLYTHVNRVSSLCQEIQPMWWDLIADYIRIDNLALHHDDPEVLTGDIPSPVKRAMTSEERSQLRSEEEFAARILSLEYLPQKYQELYMDYFHEMKEKKSNESQIVDIADKWDGLGETLHEIRCGNTAFLEVLPNYHKIFAELQRHTVWEQLREDVREDLSNLPTVEEATNLPPLSLEHVEQGGDAFWQQVFHPSIPKLLKTWYIAPLSHYPFSHPEPVIFSGWAEEVQNLGDWRQFNPFSKKVRK